MIAFSTSSLVGVGLIFVSYWLLSSLYTLCRSCVRQVPGPWPAKLSSLWRIWFTYDGTGHEGYRKLHQKYGPIVRTAPNVVDISDPSVIPIIYSINSKFLKSDFYKVFVPLHKGELLPNMFAARDTEQHKALKRPVAAKFSMTSILALEHLVDPCSKIFTDAMADLQGEIVDLGAWVQWYAFDVIGEITFKQRFGFMEQRKDINNTIAGIETGLVYASLVGQIPALHDYLLGSATVNYILTKLTGGAGNPMPTIDQMIRNCLMDYDREASEKPDREDFLAYLRRQQVKGSVHMTDNDFLGHLSANLLAGSDTTAISLRAVFYYLLKNNNSYRTLQKEIDDANTAGKLSPIITFSESLQLKYLQACLKEAMRMHPGVQFPLERVVPAGGATLCDVYLREGTIVGVNPGVVHRNTNIFGPDSDQFRPERWLNPDEEVVKMMERNILTFGAGVRTCTGKNIAIMEMGKLVPQIIRLFDIEWASNKPEWKVETYWFAKQSDLHVRMRSRTAL